MQAPTLLFVIIAAFTATISQCTAEDVDIKLECVIESLSANGFLKEGQVSELFNSSDDRKIVKKNLAKILFDYATENDDNLDLKAQVLFAKQLAQFYKSMAAEGKKDNDQVYSNMFRDVNFDYKGCVSSFAQILH